MLKLTRTMARVGITTDNLTRTSNVQTPATSVGKVVILQKIVATSSAKDVGSKDMGCATAETML